MFLSLPRFHDIWGDRKVNLIWTANCLGPSTAVGLFYKCPVKPPPVLYLMGQLVPVIARALPGDVADATALVASLGPSVGAVLHNMAHLVAVVAGVLVLAAVPRDVAGAVALVAPIFFLPALASKVTKPVALVALGSTTPVAEVATTAAKSARFWRTVRTSVSVATATETIITPTSVAATTASAHVAATSISTTAPNITAAIALRALPCKVSNSVTSVANRSSHVASTIALGAFSGKVTGPVTAVAHRVALAPSATTPAPAVALIRVGALSGEMARTVAPVAHRFSSSPASFGLVLPDDVVQAHVHLIHTGLR